jgi:hypothetical protein
MFAQAKREGRKVTRTIHGCACGCGCGPFVYELSEGQMEYMKNNEQDRKEREQRKKRAEQPTRTEHPMFSGRIIA